MSRDLIKIGTGETVDLPLLQAEELIHLSKKIDSVDDNTVYYGWAKPGSVTSSAVWRIMKETISGDITSYIWADGNTKFDNVWDDRASPNKNYS